MAHENLLWGEDDQTWEFPNLQEDQIKNKSNEDGDEKVTADAPASKGKKRNVAAVKKGGGDKDKGGGGGGGESDHELHIWTERERRKKMRNMFASLHSLLPHLPPKADKSTIVDEAVNHIKKLQQTLEKLEKQKCEKLHGINNNSIITQQNLAITMSREAFLAEQGSTSNPNHPLFMGPEYSPVYKTWTSPNVVLNVSGRDAHISICGPKKACLFTGICFVMEKYKLEVVSAQVSSDRTRCMYMIHTHANGGCDLFPVEEIYKQAAAEIMLWVNS